MHSELRSLQAAMQAATLAPKKLMDHPWPPGYVTFLQGHTDTVILMREAPVDKDVRVAAVGAEMLMTILPVDDRHSSIIWVLRSSIHLVAWNASNLQQETCRGRLASNNETPPKRTRIWVLHRWGLMGPWWQVDPQVLPVERSEETQDMALLFTTTLVGPECPDAARMM